MGDLCPGQQRSLRIPKGVTPPTKVTLAESHHRSTVCTGHLLRAGCRASNRVPSPHGCRDALQAAGATPVGALLQRKGQGRLSSGWRKGTGELGVWAAPTVGRGLWRPIEKFPWETCRRRKEGWRGEGEEPVVIRVCPLPTRVQVPSSSAAFSLERPPAALLFVCHSVLVRAHPGAFGDRRAGHLLGVGTTTALGLRPGPKGHPRTRRWAHRLLAGAQW